MPETSARDFRLTNEKFQRKWMQEITYALEREKKYREKARKCVDLYEAKAPEEVPFAIFYSNTEVLQPAVYNAKPIPVVQRRFKDADPLGKAVSEVSTRVLKYLIDCEGATYDSFDDLMQPAVTDGLVTNRGLTRFKFVPGTSGKPSDCVYGEAVRWDKFFHGYARTWKKVPWIGFEWDMTEEEARANFPNMPLEAEKFTDVSESSQTKDNRDELKGVKLTKVYEIWDKAERKVYFFSSCYSKGALKVVDDPLGLSSFFPVPRPLNFLRKITTLVPTPLYEYYKSQANELNDLTRRLKAVIKAIRFRGAYNAAVEGIEKMLNAEDNTLVPVENVQSMPDGTGMDKLLWTVPINELAQTAQSLYQQRESVKQVIYEITGISDILRGASQASETATAQQIKNQWGSLRLKKMQKEVQRYCRDCLAIILEIAGKHFEIQTFRQMTGAPFMTAMEKQALQAQLAQAQQPPMSGAPPTPLPQIPPEVQQALQAPTWEEILQVLRDDVSLHYKTDIETNSTIDAEAAQDKQDIADLLNALSQFLNGIGPLVQEGIMPFDIAKQMLLVIARRYNFGSQLEDSIISMTAPQKGPDPAEAAKSQQMQLQAQVEAQKAQQEMEMMKLEFDQKVKLMQAEMQIKLQELEIKKQELQLQERALGLKAQVQQQAHSQKMQQMALQAEAAEKKEKEPAHANA